MIVFGVDRFDGAGRLNHARLGEHEVQVTAALFGGHFPGHRIEMGEHGGAAVVPDTSGLREEGRDFRGHGVGAEGGLAQEAVLFGDAAAEVGAGGAVGGVEVGDPRELGVGQLELVLQPGELRSGRGQQAVVLAGLPPIGDSEGQQAGQQSGGQDQGRAEFHGRGLPQDARDEGIEAANRKLTTSLQLADRQAAVREFQARMYDNVVAIKCGDMGVIQATRASIKGYKPYRIPRFWGIEVG